MRRRWVWMAVVAVAVVTMPWCRVDARALRFVTDPWARHLTVMGNGVGSFILTAENPTERYAPPFTGNGFLGVRVPAAGQGYAAGTVPALSEVAGFYAQPNAGVQERANLPTWSTLTLMTEPGAHDRVVNWRQRLDLRTGIVVTTMRRISSTGRVTDMRYTVFTDRVRAQVGVVRLDIMPHWSGMVTVADLIDGSPATDTVGVGKGRGGDTVWETVRTKGIGVVAGIASRMVVGSRVVRAESLGGEQTVGQRMTLPVHRGGGYHVVKYVGVSTSNESGNPESAARAQSSAAATAGYDRLVAENAAAWKALWASRIELRGNPWLATEVNAGQFALWASIRHDTNWSVSPAGLSSNGYAGHVFWDTETWMYPALLAQHPDLAARVNSYRFRMLAAAERHASETGSAGAQFPWESAWDGTEQVPPPESVNSEGRFERHVTADVALAQWQYYLSTGDRAWLADRGWPVIAAAARMWVSRVRRAADGSLHLDHITGPDEENPDVADEAYTLVAAAHTVQIARTAASVLGVPVPPEWAVIAAGLRPRVDPASGVHREFASYRGQLVKQADVTMLTYPWQYPMPPSTARKDLDYYAARADPDGPSMTDAVNAIDAAALDLPGCAAYVYTRRSVEPFTRDVFDQFSENRTGGAFTFMTGIGGLLQEFLYGYSGLRWDRDAVVLDPSVTRQLGEVILHRISWHGTLFTVDIGPETTTVSMESSGVLPVRVAGRAATVSAGAPLTVPTRRPDRDPTVDAARCRPASASGTRPGAEPLAAVDGDSATYWQPSAIAATLTVPLAHPTVIGHVTVRWGRRWPAVPGPNRPPPPGPVITLRATDYDIMTSLDGRRWALVQAVRGRRAGSIDELRFLPVRTRLVRLRIIDTVDHLPAMVGELAADG